MQKNIHYIYNIYYEYHILILSVQVYYTHLNQEIDHCSKYQYPFVIPGSVVLYHKIFGYTYSPH